MAFWAWYWVFYEYKITFGMLLDSAVDYRTDWKELNQERQSFFKNMCLQD